MIMMNKQYKMVSINYTDACRKNPRCSFCYLKRRKVIEKLQELENDHFIIEDHLSLYKKAEQIAIAYNGVMFNTLIIILDRIRTVNPHCLIHITTNPEFLIELHIRVLKETFGIKMIALSLDYEKCQVSEWIKTAKLIQKHKMLVSVNILMLDKMYSKIPKILERIAPYCKQIHFLRPKFYNQKVPLEKRKEIIFLLKQKYKNLLIDQCFRNEFFGTPCTRGKDFVSINADNTVTACSFETKLDKKRNYKKCPYI